MSQNVGDIGSLKGRSVWKKERVKCLELSISDELSGKNEDMKWLEMVEFQNAEKTDKVVFVAPTPSWQSLSVVRCPTQVVGGTQVPT
jgi:hypothetical protein